MSCWMNMYTHDTVLFTVIYVEPSVCHESSFHFCLFWGLLSSTPSFSVRLLLCIEGWGNVSWHRSVVIISRTYERLSCRLINEYIYINAIEFFHRNNKNKNKWRDLGNWKKNGLPCLRSLRGNGEICFYNIVKNLHFHWKKSLCFVNADWLLHVWQCTFTSCATSCVSPLLTSLKRCGGIRRCACS